MEKINQGGVIRVAVGGHVRLLPVLIDNLDTVSAGKGALDARQGNALKQLILEALGDVSNTIQHVEDHIIAQNNPHHVLASQISATYYATVDAGLIALHNAIVQAVNEIDGVDDMINVASENIHARIDEVVEDINQAIENIWNSSTFVGPKGDDGPRGPDGPKGNPGEKGEQGEPGLGINIKGEKPNISALPSDSTKNDAWFIVDGGELAVWSGTQWIMIPGMHGLQGEQGNDGIKGDPGEKGDPETSYIASIILNADDWTDNRLEIINEHIHADTTDILCEIILSIALDATDSEKVAFYEAKIKGVSQSDGQLIIEATGITPTENIAVSLKLRNMIVIHDYEQSVFSEENQGGE